MVAKVSTFASREYAKKTYISNEHKVLNDNDSPLDIILIQNHLRNPVRQLITVQDQRLDILRRIFLSRCQLLLPGLI